jgi:hypothetical protein
VLHVCSPLGRALLAPKRTLLLRSFVAVDVDSLPLYSAKSDSGTAITLLLLQGCRFERRKYTRMSATVAHYIQCVSAPTFACLQRYHTHDTAGCIS